MKRIIEFKYFDNEYYLEENGAKIFRIKVADLKFGSLDFYNGVYKGKSADIELINKATEDPYKKGGYIFTWLSEIVSDIKQALPLELSNEQPLASHRNVRLYEFAACAGNGSFIDDATIPYSEIEDSTGEADYAVKVSGKSMEPIILDQSIVFVKKEAEAMNNTIGLFIVDGELMCKRYVKQGRGYKLVPENKDYKSIAGKSISTIEYLGRVLIKQ